MRVLQFFMGDSSRAALSTTLVTKPNYSRSSKSKSKKPLVSTYCEVLQNMIRTYASDYITDQAEVDLVNFRQQSKMIEET